MANVTIESGSNVTNVTNVTCSGSIDHEYLAENDVSWVLANSFIILTMQSGFGLLECGFVSAKSITNIMFKNTVDVVVGGLAYWLCGFGLSFGEPSNWFCGFGNFLFSPIEGAIGSDHAKYVFQFSYASTATTIVSGAAAERIRMDAYIVFSFFNIFVYVFPAKWAWSDNGFLAGWGFMDFAGSCVVHMTGGVSALVAAWMLGPRLHRFPDKDDLNPETVPKMSSPVTAMSGCFVLWWAWLGFNCGATFGVTGSKWKYAALCGTNTLNGSIGGGCIALLYSYITKKGKFDISMLISGVLGGLVGITAGCAVVKPGASLIIGAISGLTAIACDSIINHFHIDDPVSAFPVHGAAGAIGTILVGFFANNFIDHTMMERNGLFYNGGWTQLGVQCASVAIIAIWSIITTYLMLGFIDRLIGLRLTEEEEILGADVVDHGLETELKVDPRDLKHSLALFSKRNDRQNDALTGITDLGFLPMDRSASKTPTAISMSLATPFPTQAEESDNLSILSYNASLASTELDANLLNRRIRQPRPMTAFSQRFPMPNMPTTPGPFMIPHGISEVTQLEIRNLDTGPEAVQNGETKSGGGTASRRYSKQKGSRFSKKRSSEDATTHHVQFSEHPPDVKLYNKQTVQKWRKIVHGAFGQRTSFMIERND